MLDENIGEEPKAPEDTTTTEQEGLVPYPVINTVDSSDGRVYFHKTEITSLSQIDTQHPLGRLFMAALVKLTMGSQRDKTPDEVIEQCNDLAHKMFVD